MDMLDTGLVLGLGVGCSVAGSHSSVPKQGQKPSPISVQSLDSGEPSLTLGRPCLVADVKGPSSPQSMASTMSNGTVKRERDVNYAEKVSSTRISDQEDEEGSSKKKLRLTKDQSALLEKRFKEHSTLNPKQKLALAKQLDLRPRQVEVWFQNRRARTKLKQTEVDCEFLKRCCETLTDENRRLQKELQQLKNMASTPFFNMKIPTSTATLTMCPSCERINNSNNTNASKDNKTTTYMKAPHFHNHITQSSSAAC